RSPPSTDRVVAHPSPRTSGTSQGTSRLAAVAHVRAVPSRAPCSDRRSQVVGTRVYRRLSTTRCSLSQRRHAGALNDLVGDDHGAAHYHSSMSCGISRPTAGILQRRLALSPSRQIETQN